MSGEWWLGEKITVIAGFDPDFVLNFDLGFGPGFDLLGPHHRPRVWVDFTANHHPAILHIVTG